MSDEGAIEFACPSCDHVSRVPASFAGKQGRCPNCQALLEVPIPEGLDVPAAPPAASATPPVPSADEPPPVPSAYEPPVVRASAPVLADEPASGGDDLRPCPLCGEQIRQTAKKCRFCGEFLDGRKRGDAPGAVDARSTEMPGVIDYFLCIFCGCIGLIIGVVAILQGYHRRGLIMIGLSLFVAVVFGILGAL